VLEDFVKEGSMFLVSFNPKDLGFDCVHKTGGDSGLEMTDRELRDMVRKNITKEVFKTVQMGIMWMFLGKKSDTNGLQGVKLVLLERRMPCWDW
jgi:hypothetical protein